MYSSPYVQMFLILEKEVGELFQGKQDTLICCSPSFNYCKMCNLSQKTYFQGKYQLKAPMSMLLGVKKNRKQSHRKA